MSCCEPEDDQNVTGLAFVGSHGLPQSVWKSDWLKCRIIGQTKPPAGSAAPLIRATAVAPAMSVDCPLAVPNRPRYVRFACTRTKTVAGATVLPPVTRLPGAGHPRRAAEGRPGGLVHGSPDRDRFGLVDRPEGAVRVRDLKRCAVHVLLVHPELDAAARPDDGRCKELGSCDSPAVRGVLHDPALGHAVAPLRAQGKRGQQHDDGESHDDECLTALVLCLRACA